MIVKPRITDGGLVRAVAIGDLVGAAENITTLATAGAGTLTGPIIATNIFSRTGPTGAVNDTTDTASAIILALQNAAMGDTYRLRYINNVAFAITVVGGTGVTVVNPIVNASSVKDFLVQVTSSAPQTVVSGSITSGSAVISGLSLARTSAISIGQLVTGTGIPANAKVIGITSGTSVTISANATATTVITALTFSPSVTITGIGQGLL